MRTRVFIALVWLMGCGDTSDGTIGSGACAAFTPCGGSIVGTWRIAEACSSITPSATSACIPNMLVGYSISSDVALNGTTTFAEDGTYSYSSVENGTVKVIFPRRCFTDPTLTCAQFESQIRWTPEFSASCGSTTAGDCECTERFTNYTREDHGTYATSGSSITTVSDSDPDRPSQTDYCVEGDTLTLRTTLSTYDGSTIETYTRE